MKITVFHFRLLYSYQVIIRFLTRLHQNWRLKKDLVQRGRWPQSLILGRGQVVTLDDESLTNIKIIIRVP